jgi:hypothetical protein
VTEYLTLPLQSVQGLDVQSVLDAFQLLKRRVFFSPLNARKAGLFANLPELFAQFLAPVFLIFSSHMLINIASFERDRHV